MVKWGKRKKDSQAYKKKGSKGGKMKGAKRTKRIHAKDFGDNPDIRHSHGEIGKGGYNPAEPWEKRYRQEKVKEGLTAQKIVEVIKDL